MVLFCGGLGWFFELEINQRRKGVLTCWEDVARGAGGWRSYVTVWLGFWRVRDPPLPRKWIDPRRWEGRPPEEKGQGLFGLLSRPGGWRLSRLSVFGQGKGPWLAAQGRRFGFLRVLFFLCLADAPSCS